MKDIVKKIKQVGPLNRGDAGIFALVSVLGLIFSDWQAVPFFYILFILRAALYRSARRGLFYVMLASLGYLAMYLLRPGPAPFFFWMWTIYFLAGLSVVVFSYAKRIREERYRMVYLKKQADLEEATMREMTLRQQVERIEERLKESSGVFSGVKQMLRERLDLQDVLKFSAGMVEWVSDRKNIIFLVGGEEEQQAEVVYCQGVQTSLRGRQFPLKPDGVLTRLWGGGNVKLINRPEMEFPGLVIPRAFASLLVCPLIFAGETIGLVLLYDEKQGSLDNDLVKKVDVLRPHIELGVGKAVLYNRYEELSITDGLTRLYSRRYFIKRAEEELQRAGRYGSSVSIAIGDLDHFKECNDEYGHLAGDEVLKTAASVLREGIELPSLVCRYGGEEFAYLMVDYSKKQAKEKCEEIRERMAKQTIPAIKQKAVNISFGLATFPDDSEQLESLLELADQALYSAKRGGRNQVVEFSAQIAAAEKKKKA